MQSYVSGVRGDISIFRSTPALNGLIRAHQAGGIDPVDGVAEKTWQGRIGAFFSSELEAKPAYSELRIIGIDDGHREIVRVDRFGPGGAIRIVAGPELKPKGDRGYFRETISLPPGEIYVSPLNLYRRDGVIATPHIPTLRVAAPIYSPDGKPFGIVIADVDMRPALDRARASVRQSGDIYVVNARGDYLVHPDPAREFGSQLGTPTNWQRDFPALASSLGASESAAQIVTDQAGHPGGVALAPAILAASEWVAVIETVPNADFTAPAATIRQTAMLVGLIAVLCAAALAVLVARSLTGPIRRLTAAVEGAGSNIPIAVPVDARSETGVLARAFARVMSEANAKTTALEREVLEHRRTEAARDHYAARERIFSAAVESSSDAIVTYIPRRHHIRLESGRGASLRIFRGGSGGQKYRSPRAPRPVAMRRMTSCAGSARGETVEPFETVRRRKDGSAVEISLSVSPIKAPSGAIIGVSTTARDITESRRTQHALSQQIEERRRIFETSQDLILVTDPQGVLVQVSPSSQTILGYAPEEMIGHSAIEFFILGEDLDKAREEMRAARRGQHTGNFDSRYVHKDGRIVTLSWMGTWSEPVKRHFFIGRDMTESRQAQEALRESEQMARRIIDTAIDAFFQSDQRGSILSWNWQAETIFGWPRQEVLGKNLFELIFASATRDELKAALERFLHSGQDEIRAGRRDVMARRRDGKEFRAELSVTAMKTREGFVFNTFVRDLTDKIAAEDRIRQAEKMEAVGQLTGGIAHDFNNILTVITGTIEILAEAVEKEPQLSAITRMIDEAASRGADLTQHLLAFARKQPLQPRETDVNTLIADTVKLLRPTLGEQIEIELAFESDACLATVDPNQLATAILNLALNARDAMPGGGKLVLETGSAYLDENYASQYSDVRPGLYTLIAVSDTGTGIPAAIIDKVFNPFFTSKGPGKGTGLGLSMVYGFVKQSAGHIRIYSEEGHGTTIRMYLPPGTGAPFASGIDAPTAIEGGPETILVVEDDKLVRDYVLTQLRSLGYVTLDAANGTEALALVEAGHAFDLLFTDVIMPGAMNGRQLADEIARRRPGLKVLFTSGYTENAIIHHGRLDTGVLLLAKPYRKSELAGMIRIALSR